MTLLGSQGLGDGEVSRTNGIVEGQWWDLGVTEYRV